MFNNSDEGSDDDEDDDVDDYFITILNNSHSHESNYHQDRILLPVESVRSRIHPTEQINTQIEPINTQMLHDAAPVELDDQVE